MKRDLDLVRHVMLQIEALPASPPVQYRAGEVEDPVLLKHLEMLIAAGLVSGKISQSHGSRGDVISISGLTWDGHEWVEMVRSQAVWNEIKTTLMERAGAVTFELTREVARRILLARVGLSAPREVE
ncbi:MAG TPA: DUF2513 domain-containing protein [Gemmatimonadaceae bacterium]|nr:DUF2513 domain-containing protein [Gemmatimonadaceae bacterium]